MLKQLLDNAKRYTVWISFLAGIMSIVTVSWGFQHIRLIEADTNANEQKIWDLQRAIYETQAACDLQASSIKSLNEKMRIYHR